jgi:hypothetical protein
MPSAFTGDQLGFGYRPTDEQIDKINRRRRTGKHYVSTELAKHLQTERTNKPELTKEMFDADLIDSPFLKLFKFGAANEGYWTHHHMKLQFEDLIDCLQIAFPNHNIVPLFDQSAGHTTKREEGLDATNTNVRFGGKTTPMRDSTLTKDKFGAFPLVLKAGDDQAFDFPCLSDCGPDDGPFWMTQEEKLATREDAEEPALETKQKTYKEVQLKLVEKRVLTPNKRPKESNLLKLIESRNDINLMKVVSNDLTRDKTNAKLVSELTATGHSFQQRNYWRFEIVQLATIFRINPKKTERKKVEG